MSSIGCVDELDRYAHPIADLPDASLHQVLGPEFLGDFAHIYGSVLVDETGVARDDEQLVAARQFREDVFGKTVREKFLIGVAAHIVEGQNHYRGFGDRSLRIEIRRLSGQGGVLKSDTKQTNGTAYIFQHLLAQILDGDFETIGDLCCHGGGDTDTAHIGKLLNTRSNIHTVAENVAVFENDIAEIDADPEFDPPILRHVRISPLHALLDLHGALYCISHALEFHEHAVARRLDDPALVLCDGGIDQFYPVRFEAGDRACFVGLHQPAIACHIGCQDCG